MASTSTSTGDVGTSVKAEDHYSLAAQSLQIPFPAPFPDGSAPTSASTSSPTRSKRSAAAAASSAISRSAVEGAANIKAEADEDDADLSPPQSSDAELTNDDTAESYTLGETDENPLDEDAYNPAIKDGTATATDEEEMTVSPSKRKRVISSTKRKRGVVKSEDEEIEPGSSSQANGEDSKAPQKRKAATPHKPKKAVAQSTNGEDGGHASDSSALTNVEDLHDELDENGKPKKKKRKASTKPKTPRKPRAPKPEPVYVIPDVEKMPNPGFKGRLGYACLNTVLRKKKPPVFCSRTCRIDTINKNGMDFLKELARQNCIDLLQLIQWNEDNNIRFMRISSEMFPFAAHNDYGYSLEYADAELKAVGELARRYGHRLTSHPGQFTQLGSPRKVVVENAVKDLAYHCEMFDRMGMGNESVMIIHGGGVFGDKPAALERFRENYKTLLPDNVKGRLVLENDEICYNVDDLLPICEELNIPLVLDYHHHSIYPTAEQSLEELMPRILATWERKNIRPKFHLSEPRNGAVTIMERRAHSDRCKKLPTPLPSDIDLMIEAKDKEQAVFELHRIYDLQPTIHESLRPPAEVESLRTNGRKSSKKKKKAVDEDGGNEEDMEGLEDPENAVLEHDEALVDVGGAEVMPPPEPSASSPTKKKTPAKPRQKKVKAENGENGADEVATNKTPKTKTPRKPRAKKAANEDQATAAEVAEQALAAPPEVQTIEDMKMKDVPQAIIEAVPCSSTTACAQNAQND